MKDRGIQKDADSETLGTNAGSAHAAMHWPGTGDSRDLDPRYCMVGGPRSALVGRMEPAASKLRGQVQCAVRCTSRRKVQQTQPPISWLDSVRAIHPSLAVFPAWRPLSFIRDYDRSPRIPILAVRGICLGRRLEPKPHPTSPRHALR